MGVGRDGIECIAEKCSAFAGTVGNAGVDKIEIVACILVGRIEAQGALIGNNRIAHLAEAIIGVAEIVI